MKIVTSWYTLMHLAHAVGQAKKAGDPEKIATAEAELRAYEKLVLDSDETIMSITVGELYAR